MKKRPRSSFKKKMVITIIISSIVPMLIVGLFSLYFVNRVSVGNTEQRLKDSLLAVDKILTQSIDNFLIELDDLGRNEDVLAYLNNPTNSIVEDKKINNLFYNYMGSQSDVMNVYLIGKNGNEFGTSELPVMYDLKKYNNWGIFRAINNQRDNQTLFYPNYTDEPSRFSNSFSLIRSIHYNDQEEGYIIVDFSTEFIQNHTNAVKGTSFGYIQFIVASSQNDIIYNDSSFKNQVKFLSNIFGYDRFSPENAQKFEVDLDKLMIESYRNEKLGLSYYGIIPDEMLVDQGKALTLFISVITALVGVITLLTGLKFAKQISKPILDLAQRMKFYDGSKDDFKIDESTAIEIYDINYQYVELLNRMNESYEEGLEKQELLKRVEIKSLLSQMNPHFLHNTLDSIKWKAKLNETEDIAFMVTELGHLLKASMDTSNTFVSVREELDFIESYINIQKLRYEDRFSYVSHLNPELNEYLIPKFILQPIVENALIHGIEPLSDTGIIEIRSWIDEDYLFFAVSDNGVGSEKTLEEFLSLTDSSSIGLKNVIKRLRLYYSEEASLTWDSKIGVGTIVLIKLPIKKGVIQNV